MSTQQVAFYTNRVGKVEKMASDKQTERQTNPEETKLLLIAHLLQIYSHTPAHKLRTTDGAPAVHRDYVYYVLPGTDQCWNVVGVKLVALR